MVLDTLREKLVRITTKHLFVALAGYIGFLCVVQSGVIAFSLGKVRIEQEFAVLILFAGLLAGCLFGISTKSRWPELERSSEPSNSRLRWIPTALIVAAACGYALLWFSAYIKPDLSFDGNTYHLPPISLWSKTGYIYWITDDLPSVEYMNGYPKGAELMGFVLTKAFNSSDLVNTFNLVFLPLGVLGIACIAKLMDVSSDSALLAGMLFILVPVNIFQSSTTYVDTSFASAVIALFAVILCIAWRISVRTRLWPLLPPFGGAIGLVLGIKSTGIIFAVIGTSCLVAAVLLTTRSNQHRLRTMLIFIFLAWTIGLLIGGFWYVRNYTTTGSPLFPAGFTIVGQVLFPGEPWMKATQLDQQILQEMHGQSRIVQVFLAWLQGGSRWLREILSGAGNDSRIGGLGYLWLIGCIPCIALVLWRNLRSRSSGPNANCMQKGQIFWILFAMVTLSFVATPLNWWARFTIWILALGLPCFAIVVDEIIFRSPTSLHGRVWIAACLSVLILETTTVMRWQVLTTYRGSWKNNITGLLHKENWQWPTCSVFPPSCGTMFDQISATDAPVALSPVGMTGQSDDWWVVWKPKIVGQLSVPLGKRSIMALPAVLDAKVVAEIVSQRVKYIIWDDSLKLPEELKPLATEVVHAAGFWILILDN